jgi:uncharacterized protein
LATIEQVRLLSHEQRKIQLQPVERFSAFDGSEIFFEGPLREVAEAMRSRLMELPDSQILVFSQTTGRQTDIYLDLPIKCMDQDLSLRTTAGRNKLGLVGQEVTLLPRHWEWLNSQPGGASAALRKLVEMGIRENAEKDATRQRHEAAYRFMTALAGDLPGYEEALRCLFANDRDGLVTRTKEWPADLQRFALQLTFPAIARDPNPTDQGIQAEG